MIINIGFNRAGTSSLWVALKILGFKAIHNPYAEDINIFWDNVNSNRKLLDNMDYDAFTDNPFLQKAITKLLIEQYPNAYFIYTKRNHIDRLKSEYENFDEKFAKTWVTWETHKESFIDYILRDNPDIKVLEFNICDKGHGWKELCDFLGKEIPSEDFPHQNKKKWR